MLQEKVIIVTGAGRGIGREFALDMARHGARVVVNDIGTSVNGQGQDEGPAQSVVNEIREAGGQAVANIDSVADWISAQRIVQNALDSFGRVDGIVNNAGILRDRFFYNMDPEEWRTVLNVHLDGTFYVSRAAATHFRAQQGGSYVHIVSTSGLIGNLAQANYSAAKAGIAALSKSIAMDMSRFNVRSNCISPFAWSRMIGALPTETEEQKERVARLQRMEASKIAPLATYLMNDSAAKVSGQIFAVRANEIFLMSQMRPLRSIHDSEGWTAEKIQQRVIPALQAGFYPLDRSQDVFCWDPV